MLSAAEGPVRKLSLPSRGGWIEISMLVCRCWAAASLPSRGGWIEIAMKTFPTRFSFVPPPTGRVD